MDDDLKRLYGRWREADESGREQDAERACRAFFDSAGRDPRVSTDFTARTRAAIAAAGARDRERARRTQQLTLLGGTAAAVLALVFGGSWALAALSRVLLGSIDLLVGLSVRIATSIHAGTDLWSIVASVGRALAAFVADPAVTAAILAMQGVAMVALLALHRLLGSDRETLK
jgi:hypothetical protein